MPTVFTDPNPGGYRFFFYSNERNEPVHVHVEKDKGYGKIWLEPEIEVSYFWKFTPKQEREILEIVRKRVEEIIRKWNEHFS